MKSLLLPAMLLAFGTNSTGTLAGENESTLQGWIEMCDPHGSQQAITACVIVETAQARDLLDAVLDEIVETYTGHDIAGPIAGLPSAQDDWNTQMQADIDALFPLEPGQHPSVTYGSSYTMRTELLRAAITRQRVAFLCDAWLPPQVRRKPPADAPSLCANINAIGISGPAGQPVPD